mgnify:CR=1 FL=1
MALLQVEKVLPYGLDAAEVVVSTILTDTESTEVAAVAAAREQIDLSAAPLTDRRNWPFRVLTNAQRIAARAPTEGTAALFFEEHGEPHLVVAEKGIATFTQPLIGREVETLAGELPGVLLAAAVFIALKYLLVRLYSYALVKLVLAQLA